MRWSNQIDLGREGAGKRGDTISVMLQHCAIELWMVLTLIGISSVDFVRPAASASLTASMPS